MGDLSKMSDSAKVAFLIEALSDAAHTLWLKGFDKESACYMKYLRELRGEQQNQEASHG